MAERTLHDLPERIGSYPVRAKLGRGGMAEVYDVVDPTTGGHLAIKCQRTLASQKRLTEALREYQLLNALDHPGLPRVYRLGFTDDGRPYVAMERLAGELARTRVATLGPPERPERVAAVLELLVQAADALRALHQVGVVHGDVKPSNMLVGVDGSLHLVDLAGARLLTAETPWIPEGSFYGTYEYSAPEQLARVAVDTAADCYSLGVAAYLLLTGANPFKDADRATIIERHRNLVPDEPRAVNPAVPQEVSALVMALLEKEPANRPSATEARDRLSAWRRGGASRVPTPPAPFGLEDAARVTQHQLQRFGAEVLVTGWPGAGRSVLLDHLAAEAAARGWRVAVLRGASAEVTETAKDVLRGLGDVDLVVTHDLDRLDPVIVGALRQARALLTAPPALLASALPGVGFRKLFAQMPVVSMPTLNVDTVSRHPAWGERRPSRAEAWSALRLSGGLAAHVAHAIERLAEADRSDTGSEALPNGLVDRIGRLDEKGAAIAAALALASAPVDVASLSEALQLGIDEVEARLLKTKQLGIARRRALDGRWMIASGLAGQSALARIPPEIVAPLANRLVGALHRVPIGPAQVALLAAAGRVEDAVYELLLWFRGAPPEQALPLFEALVPQVDELSSEMAVNLLRGAARTLSAVDPLNDRAERWLDKALERSVEPQTEATQLERLAWRRRVEKPWRDDLLPPLAVARSRLLAAERHLSKARDAGNAGRWQAARESATLALQAGRSEGDLEQQAAALALLGEAHFAFGEITEAEQRLARALSTARAARLSRGRIAAELARVLRVQGQISLAGSTLLDADGPDQTPLDRAWLQLGHAENALELGRLHAVEALIDILDASPVAQQHSLRWERARLRTGLEIERGTLRGDIAMPAGDQPALLRTRLLVAHAHLLARRGSTDDAVALIEAAETILADAHHLPWWTEACVVRVTVLGLAGQRQPLPDPVREWLGIAPATLLRMHYYRAVAQRDGGGPAEIDALRELEGMLPALSPDDRAAYELMPWVARASRV